MTAPDLERDRFYAEQADKLHTTPEHLRRVVRSARLLFFALVVLVAAATLVPSGVRSAVGFTLLGALGCYYAGSVRALFTGRTRR